ncbi:restriction endonuclease s subunits [Gluconobacter frateurii NBRC 103465]|nr:restriction endonuclease s subunits [Gluconobacter frateurii NBRC 103465]
MLPEGWKVSTVGKALSIQNELRKPISAEIREKNVGPYAYYGPTKAQGFINTFEQNGRFCLIGEDGDHFLKFSTLSMTKIISGKCTVNNHAHILSNSSKCIIDWFFYYFMHRDISSHLTRQGAGRYKLTKKALEKLPIPFSPPLPRTEEDRGDPLDVGSCD